MEKVLGIVGFFFRANAEHLGVKAMINARGNNSRALPCLPRSEPTVTISAAPTNNG